VDVAEQLVARWLVSRGHRSIVHEPDGNTPPDLLVDGRIAVEVRRFTQVRDLQGHIESLAETTIPLVHGLLSELRRCGPPTDGQSWFVFLSFRGSLSWSSVRSRVRSHLETFSPQNPSDLFRIQLSDRVSLSFCSAGEQLDHRFVLGGYSDHEAGGWVVAELIKSMRILVAEKSRKVADFLRNYPEWWLVMVDTTSLGLSAEDFARGQQHFPEKGLWSKIILLNGSCTSALGEI
jgi:hypothetical protein